MVDLILGVREGCCCDVLVVVSLGCEVPLLLTPGRIMTLRHPFSLSVLVLITLLLLTVGDQGDPFYHLVCVASSIHRYH